MTRIEDLVRREFREAAMAQRVCRGCGRTDRWAAHHVVYAQEVRRRGGNEWDGRNAMRLCDRCHGKHHGPQRIALGRLSEANLDFAFELLGPFAYDYLRRRYTGDDPRLEDRLARAA